LEIAGMANESKDFSMQSFGEIGEEAIQKGKP
jgi:hypothetical protein